LSADPKHGPLPALLLTLTVVTGLVDAVSVLSLGRVFVANMTGNVVFVGFALSGAPGFSLSASLFALGGFLVGAFAGGAVAKKGTRNRAELLRNTVSIELALLRLGGCIDLWPSHTVTKAKTRHLQEDQDRQPANPADNHSAHTRPTSATSAPCSAVS
jgi:hypothetical protein